MKHNKTIKRDFYNLVLKIFIYTTVSTIITYGIFFAILNFSSVKPTNYYLKFLDKITDEVKENGDGILKGNLIDLKDYDEQLHGEVIDLAGNHLYGEEGINNDKLDILSSINQEKYYNNYIYKYISITQDNSIKAIYIIRAPFDLVMNNHDSKNGIVLIYILFMASPILYFLLYLFLFTSKIYKSLSKNIDILLDGAIKISDGNFDFYIDGVEGKEFNKIQESFNTMVMVLRNNIKELSSLDEERKMMVSSIAHDIRTPITVIKGQIEIIDDLKDNPNYKINDNMKIINKNCDRMTTLTDNLSLLYKVDRENFLLKNEKVDLRKLLKDKQTEIITMSEKNNLEIDFKVNLEKDKYILDENMLLRVLDNILYNSLRFTQKGKIALEVYDDMENKKINFKCSDTGTGFKQEDKNKLFKAFYQDDDYKNHFGLGLFIAQKIINNYNGEIKAYNNKFGGATIEFYIKELEEY